MRTPAEAEKAALELVDAVCESLLMVHADGITLKLGAQAEVQISITGGGDQITLSSDVLRAIADRVRSVAVAWSVGWFDGRMSPTDQGDRQ